MTQQLLWDEAVDRLRSRVSPQNYDMWLRPIELKSWDGETLRLRAPNSYVRLWFESNFLSTLVKELRDLGHDVRVEFEPDGEDRIPEPQLVEIPIGSSPTVALIQGQQIEASTHTQTPPPAPPLSLQRRLRRPSRKSRRSSFPTPRR